MSGTDLNIHVIERLGRTDSRFSAALAAFDMSVFALVHLFIFSQGFVELFVLNQMSFPFGDFIRHDQAIVVEYPHVLVLYTKEELFSYKCVGHNIAVAFKPDSAVLENFSVDSVRRVKGIGRKEV